MATKNDPAHDPFEMWRDWLNRTEAQVNAALNQVTTSPQYSKVQGKLTDALLDFQRSMNETTQRYFQTLNVPTRADVLDLAERLSGIDQRLQQIEGSLAHLGAGTKPAAPAARARPRRTKKAPAAAANAKQPATPPRTAPKVARKRAAKK